MSNIDFTKKVPAAQLQAQTTLALALTTPLYLATEKLNREFEAAVAALTAGWPVSETSTWTIQAAEARKWVASTEDPKPAPLFLTQLWTDRQNLGWTEPFADFVGRVIANADAYTTGVAKLVAIRHVAEKQLNEATDVSTVTWSFSV